MSPAPQERFRTLSSLFHQALSVPAGEPRAAFLENACGGDSALIAEVLRLIEGDSAVRQAASTETPAMPRFGVYQAREIIGRGGMGTVYLATREDGEVRMQVAIKAIGSPLWSSVLDAGFRRERQILAQLHHPNIAVFLDSGVSAEGLPFLVMEYVEGERIDQYCDSRRLPVRRRLELFLEVCDAVAFAHQQLIVHRDLKPGNILVTASGEPKLLDFGLARNLEPQGQQAATIGLFLTPMYGSPEVLRGKPAAVTDDVYSLGVLLFELLAGKGPFGTQGGTPAEIIESVLAEEPRRASDLQGPDTEAIAAQRGETPANLRRLLQGDLNAIAAKAVAKLTSERYPSVPALADDIRHYLSGHPVSAASGSTFYQFRKFVTRHKTGAIAGAVVALSLIGGVAATLWQARVAGEQRATAERRFLEARALARYMMFELQTSIQKLPGSTPIKADMVRHSLDYLDRIAAEKSNDDALQVDIAEGYTELADVLGHPLRPNLGEGDEARRIYRKAIGIIAPVALRDSGNLQARRVLARAQLMLGLSLTYYRRWDEGPKLVETSAREFTQLAQKWPQDVEIEKEAAAAYESLATTISQRDGYTTAGSDVAVGHLKQSIRYAESALHLKPGDTESLLQLANSDNRLALLTQSGDRPAAGKLFESALAALDSLPAAEKSAAQVRSRRASVLLGMGWNLGSAGDFGRGVAAIGQARDIMEQLSGEDPKNKAYPQALASTYRNLGVIESYAGHAREELAADLTAISIYENLLSANQDNPYFRTTLADLQVNAAPLCIRLGRRAEGLRLARAGIAALKTTALKADASASELNLAARFLVRQDFPELRDPKLGLQLAVRAAAASAQKDYVVLETLAEAYWVNHDRDNAVRTMEQALALVETPKPGQEPSRVRKLFEKTLAEYRSGKLP